MACKRALGLLSIVLAIGFGGLARAQGCDDSALSAAVPPAAGAPRGDVMVIVNDNSPASCEVAIAYAQARKLGRYNLVHVRTPTNNWIDWAQFRLLRDQIIRALQQKLLQSNPGITLATCDHTDVNPDPAGQPYPPPYYYCAASIAQLNQMLGVNYLVTTMGVPSQVMVNIKDEQASHNDHNRPAALDNHLRLALAKYYPDRIAGGNPASTVTVDPRRKALDAGFVGGYLNAGAAEFRKVSAALDGRMVVGRIDGITVDAARQMISRTLIAEVFGVTGKLYGSPTDQPFSYISPVKILQRSKKVRWPWGVFGVSGSPCANLDDATFYLRASPSSAAGKSNADCAVQFTDGWGGAKLALPNTRQPTPHSALLYYGNQHGQPSVPGTFEGILNWRRQPGAGCLASAEATTPTCDDPGLSAAQQSACRSQSIDVLKEINSQCVGVNRGFVGFNMQSYPLAAFTVWPTGWELRAQTDPVNRPSFMRVRDNDGAQGNSHSVWLGNNIVAGYTASQPTCYRDALVDDAQHTQDCNLSGLNGRWVDLFTRLDLGQLPGGVPPVVATPTASGGQPVSFTLSFDYKASLIDTDPGRLLALVPTLYVYRKVGANGSNDNPAGPGRPMGFQALSIAVTDAAGPPIHTSYSLPVADTGGQWRHATLTYQLAPQYASACGAGTDCAALPCAATPAGCRTSDGWNGVFDRMELGFYSGSPLLGELGLTNVSFTLDGAAGDHELVVNGRFDRGYHQVSTGDHAAVFLNRLGGTAFFGSIGHYNTHGASFAHSHDTIFRSFWRGLPLGDAVWVERDVNGALYGDPLYSPVAVRLEATSGVKRAPEGLVVDKRISGSVGLAIAAVNGRGPTGKPGYSVDVCRGGEQPMDFFECDRAGLWNQGDTLAAIAGTGGREGIPATLDVSQWPDGWYTLRLRVAKPFGQNSVVYNDFLTFKIQSSAQIHVDAAAADGGTGFADAPYRSLAEAYGAALAGDHLRVAGGQYTLAAPLAGKPVDITGSGSAATVIETLEITGWNAAQAPTISGMSVGTLRIADVAGLKLRDVKSRRVTVARSSARLDNCLVADEAGAATGIYLEAGAAGDALTVNNCTIAGFTTGIAASPQAAAVTVQVRNSIFDNAGNLALAPGNTAVTYSLFTPEGSDSSDWAAPAGSHNLLADPQFIDAAAGDYRLRRGSPAINAGEPDADYSKEPLCSWPGVDLGFHGNTSGASCWSPGASAGGAIPLLLD